MKHRDGKRVSKWRITGCVQAGFYLFLLLFATQSGTVWAQERGSTADNSVDETRRVLVQFQPDAPQSERNRIIAQMNGTLVDWIAALHVAQVELRPTAQPPLNRRGTTMRAASEPLVRFLEVDAEVTGAYDPNDPDYHDNTKSYALQLIDAARGWDATLGSSDVFVAIVDSGLNMDHPEFSGRILPGYDYINDDDDVTDDHGHGTHVAGIIAAAIDNGTGTAGVCPRCTIMPVKVLNENNAGTWFSAAQGIIYAVDNGADIINLSLGATSESSTIKAAIDYAHEYDVLVIAAAGNMASSQNFYPAAYDSVLAVSATTDSDGLWGLSNHGSYVDVAAPGYSIYSTDRDLDNAYGGYSFKSGTSMASPHVAGLAGLLLSQDPKRTARDVTNLIVNSAEDLGTPGWDEQFGHGRINVNATLNPNANRTTTIPPVVLSHTYYLPVVQHSETSSTNASGLWIAAE